MIGIHNLPVFVLAGLLLAMTPGPDTAYILSRSARNGWRGGSLAALGIALGIWAHILAGAAGFSTLLVASSRAFAFVKLAGAAYLLYLGCKALLRSMTGAKLGLPRTERVTEATAKEIFWQGFLTNVLNPKVALFFLAFLPQFIDAGYQSKAIAFLFLGAVFDVVGTLWNLLVARAAAGVVSWTEESPGILNWIDRMIGVLFICLGLRLAADHQ